MRGNHFFYIINFFNKLTYYRYQIGDYSGQSPDLDQQKNKLDQIYGKFRLAETAAIFIK